MSRAVRFGAFWLALTLLTAQAMADNAAFLAEVDDLPLAPGLVEQPGGTLFDSPQGRIVEATAQGSMLEAEVRTFYDEALPQLGWTRVGPDAYRRDKEILRFEIATEGMRITVHFSLAPARSGQATGDEKGTKQ